MRRVCILVLLLALLCVPAFAVDVTAEEAAITGADALEDALDSQTREKLPALQSADAQSFGKTVWQLVTDTISGLGGYLQQTLASSGAMLAVCAACFALRAFSSTRLPVTTMGGTLALAAIAAGNVSAMMGLARQTLLEITDFSSLLLPVLSSACAASGGLTSSGVLYAGSTLFVSVLTRLITELLMPLVYAYLALAAGECMAENSGLEKLRELIGWVIQAGLKLVMTLFTAYLALTGLFSGHADNLTLKAAKAAVSGAIPVVGSIVSDATGSVLAGAGTIKSAAGIFGMLAALAMGLLPFARIGLQYLALKLCTAISGMIAQSSHVKMLGAVTTAMGDMLAMTGSAIVMVMISCCCFLRTVSG